MSYDSLLNFYNLNHVLTFDYHYSLQDLENMIPFEREIYVSLIAQRVEEQRHVEAINRIGESY